MLPLLITALLVPVPMASAGEPIRIEVTTVAEGEEPAVLPTHVPSKPTPKHRLQLVVSGGALPLYCWGLKPGAFELSEDNAWCGVRGRAGVQVQGRPTAKLTVTGDVLVTTDAVNPTDILTDIGVGVGGGFDAGRWFHVGFSFGPALQFHGLAPGVGTLGENEAYTQSISFSMALRFQADVNIVDVLRAGFRTRATMGSEVAYRWTDGRRPDVVDYENSLDARSLTVFFVRAPSKTPVGAWIEWGFTNEASTPLKQGAVDPGDVPDSARSWYWPTLALGIEVRQ